MAAASELLRATVADRGLEHPDDEELNRHVLAAVPRQLPVGWKLTKPKNKSLPIDGAIAAVALRAGCRCAGQADC